MEEDRTLNSKERKIPQFLSILLTLSLINAAAALFFLVTSIGDDPTLTMEILVERVNDQIDAQPEEAPEWVRIDIQDFSDNYLANYRINRALDTAYYLVLLPSLLLMYRKRIIGYYIYVATQVVGVLYVPFMYGNNAYAWFMFGMFSCTAVLFIVLYSLNRRYLS